MKKHWSACSLNLFSNVFFVFVYVFVFVFHVYFCKAKQVSNEHEQLCTGQLSDCRPSALPILLPVQTVGFSNSLGALDILGNLDLFWVDLKYGVGQKLSRNWQQ